jgi:hypothetical protein
LRGMQGGDCKSPLLAVRLNWQDPLLADHPRGTSSFYESWRSLSLSARNLHSGWAVFTNPARPRTGIASQSGRLFSS